MAKSRRALTGELGFFSHLKRVRAKPVWEGVRFGLDSAASRPRLKFWSRRLPLRVPYAAVCMCGHPTCGHQEDPIIPVATRTGYGAETA